MKRSILLLTMTFTSLFIFAQDSTKPKQTDTTTSKPAVTTPSDTLYVTTLNKLGYNSMIIAIRRSNFPGWQIEDLINAINSNTKLYLVSGNIQTTGAVDLGAPANTKKTQSKPKPKK